GVEGSACGVGRPQTLAFPSSLRVINASIHTLGIESHGVGHAQRHPFSVHECHQRIFAIAGSDRDVLAQAEGVELIHPVVIAGLGAARIGYPLELRRREWVECPPFGAMLSRRIGPVERTFALAPVETREMSAGGRSPYNAVSIDIEAPW